MNIDLSKAREALAANRCARGAGVWDCDRAKDGGVCSACLQRRHLRDALAAVDAMAAENQRLRDLVRHQRGALHDEGLITDDEYDDLAADHGAVARLEGYDDMRGRYAAMCDLRDALTAERDEARRLLGEVHRRVGRGVGWPDDPQRTYACIVSDITNAAMARGEERQDALDAAFLAGATAMLKRAVSTCEMYRAHIPPKMIGELLHDVRHIEPSDLPRPATP